MTIKSINQPFIYFSFYRQNWTSHKRNWKFWFIVIIKIPVGDMKITHANDQISPWMLIFQLILWCWFWKFIPFYPSPIILYDRNTVYLIKSKLMKSFSVDSHGIVSFRIMKLNGMTLSEFQNENKETIFYTRNFLFQLSLCFVKFNIFV